MSGIFDSIGHFLFGGKANSQSTGTTNTSTTTAPYAPIQPALQDFISNGLPAVYGPNGAPQISAPEQAGYDMLGKVTGDTSGIDSAVQANKDTISGKYLTPDTNPYLRDIASRIGGDAMQQVNGTFGGKGRSGSGLAGEFAGRGVGAALSDLYGSNYEAERGRQTAAIAGSPALEAGRYLAPQAAISAGQNISARPFDIAGQYSGILGNIAKLGGTTTGTGTTTGSTVGQAEAPGLVGSFINKLFSK